MEWMETEDWWRDRRGLPSRQVLEEQARQEQEQARQAAERNMARERSEHPEQWKKMRLRRNLGWALVIAGPVLGATAPGSEEDLWFKIQNGIGMATMATGGILLANYYLYQLKISKNTSVVVGPNGAAVTFTF